MFGQAPYIINSMLTYTTKKQKFAASINYNIQGTRLVIIGPNITIPDIYELPRNLLDIKISYKLGKHYNISLKIQDILNSPIVRSYKVDKNYILNFDRYNYGTNYIFALSYKL